MKMNKRQKKWIDPKKHAEPSKKPWKTTYGPPPKPADWEKELDEISQGENKPFPNNAIYKNEKGENHGK
jgi:hypothetical protein